MTAGHEPQRMCCVCRTRRPQKELIRIVRTGTDFRVAQNTRLEGRSAYVCPDGSCVEGLLKKHALDRSFGMRIGADVYEKLAGELKAFG